MAIKIDEKFIKAYIRKAKALLQLGQFDECQKCLNDGLQIEAENEELINVQQDLMKDIQADSVLPSDHI